MNKKKLLNFRRYTEEHVASGVQPGVRGDLSGCLHGARYSVGLRGFSAEIPGNPVQPGQEPGEHIHRLDSDTRCLHRHIFRWLSTEATRAEAEGGRSVRPRI